MADPPGMPARGALRRLVAFLDLSLTLAGTDPADLAIGIVAAVAATWR